ncbi:hypothetical protein ARMGADRAFT_1016075, partial [Armillaria gallica]
MSTAISLPGAGVVVCPVGRVGASQKARPREPVKSDIDASRTGLRHRWCLYGSHGR